MDGASDRSCQETRSIECRSPEAARVSSSNACWSKVAKASKTGRLEPSPSPAHMCLAACGCCRTVRCRPPRSKIDEQLCDFVDRWRASDVYSAASRFMTVGILHCRNLHALRMDFLSRLSKLLRAGMTPQVRRCGAMCWSTRRSTRKRRDRMRRQGSLVRSIAGLGAIQLRIIRMSLRGRGASHPERYLFSM